MSELRGTDAHIEGDRDPHGPQGDGGGLSRRDPLATTDMTRSYPYRLGAATALLRLWLEDPSPSVERETRRWFDNEKRLDPALRMPRKP